MDGAPFKQMIFLEHISDLARGGMGLAIQQDLTGSRLDQATYERKESGFAAA
jgi:hypothetical protein